MSKDQVWKIIFFSTLTDQNNCGFNFQPN